MEKSRQYLEQNIPLLRWQEINAKLFTLRGVYLTNDPHKGCFSEYQEEVGRIWEKLREKEKACGKMKVIFAGSDSNRIQKIAALVSRRSFDEEADIDDEDYAVFETCTGDMVYFAYLYMSLRTAPAPEHRIVPPMQEKGALLEQIRESQGFNAVYFADLNENNLEEQTEMILCSTAPHVFVEVRPEMLKCPEIQRMIFEKEFELFKIEDVPKSAYYELFNKLSDLDECRFSSEKLKKAVFYGLSGSFGSTLSEELIEGLLEKAQESAGKAELTEREFSDYMEFNYQAKDELENMPGLKNIKLAVHEYIAMCKETEGHHDYKGTKGHMLFTGNPGTGKTTGAKLLSDILASEGITNGVFVEASRASLIGNYVGQTAPKVEEAFKKADGGILFVDEAGFFLNRESGGFLGEAIKEFVRFMERYRGRVIVIFALYQEEAERFLALDDGLASRISSIISFEDYSESELMKIFELMLERLGYTAVSDAMPVVSEYLRKKKADSKEAFGNAREVRKLCDAVVRSVALRNYETGKSLKTVASHKKVLQQDVMSAVKSLDDHSLLPKKVFGFGVAYEKNMPQERMA